MYLIEAENSELGYAKAEKRATADAGDLGGRQMRGDRPAEFVFAGIRKLVRCLDGDEPDQLLTLDQEVPGSTRAATVLIAAAERSFRD